ncbi:hypothetical protein E2C01_086894 [Portunus trituberculatus]|uniref:Uncharacterized protein n=1 Tax=Portunus trituberculatus TaxID=210409 RepID=A0A5B7JHL2_PORTR|nr:hypothetical protein [Portunus trituberculatus]
MHTQQVAGQHVMHASLSACTAAVMLSPSGVSSVNQPFAQRCRNVRLRTARQPISARRPPSAGPDWPSCG